MSCSILDDPKLGQLGDGECWGFVRLLALLKREGSTDGTIRLDDRGLRYVTRRHQTRHALAMVESWASKGLLRASLEPPYTLLACSKWVEIQGRGLQSRVDKSRVEEPIGDDPPPAATAPAPKATPRQKPKRKIQCPEDLSDKQWNRVQKWRDSLHPEFSSPELIAQWTLHSQHHRSKGNTAIDWVLGFYNWLTGPFYKPVTGGGKLPPRPTPPDIVREPAPPLATEEELAEMRADGDARRAGRRARHAEAPETSPPNGAEDAPG